jgi:hypothetical protein
MTITEILGLAIGLLALLLSSELVRSGAARQKRPELNIDVGFRRVGTFGGLANVSPQTSPIASPVRPVAPWWSFSRSLFLSPPASP